MTDDSLISRASDEINVVLEGVVGSTAYGLATPDSDIDRLGVFCLPTVEILGLDGPAKMDRSIVQNGPDRTLHEVGKLMKLALAGNPTVTELLWLESYEVKTEIGDLLVSNRDLFVSNLYRKTYGGYALQQMKRLKERGDFSSDLRKRTEKHGRHCMRLIIQGSHAVLTGEVKVRLTESEAKVCRAAGELAARDVDGFERMVVGAMERFDLGKSVLPDKPNRKAVDELLINIRQNY